MCSIAHKHGSGSTQKEFHVEPRRPGFGISEIQSNHLIELDTASAIHLPEPGNAWLHVQDSSSVPCPVGRHFVGNRGTRSDQRHFSLEHIQELRKFIQATSPQECSYPRDSSVVSKLVDTNPSPLLLAWIRCAWPAINCVTYSSVNTGSLSTHIDLNLRNVKDFPYCPIRRCLNNMGPFDDALTARAMTRKTGAENDK